MNTRKFRDHTCMVVTVVTVVLMVGVTGVSAQESSESPAATKVDKKSDTGFTTLTAPSTTPTTSPDQKTATKTRSWKDDPIITPAIWGYCPVSYFEKNKATVGDAKFRSAYRGKMYHLASAEMQQKFEANPTAYVPAYGGLCTTALGGSYNNRIPSDPEVFKRYGGKLYLFSSERASKSFVRNPKWFILRADNEYFQPAIEGYCPVTYQQRIKAMVGREEIQREYNGQNYFFMNKISRAEFITDPERYVPQYDAYCAHAMMKGKRFPVDPAYFFISNNKTYLFNDEMSMVKFTMNPPSNISKADQHWAKLQSAKKMKHASSTTSSQTDKLAPKTTTASKP